MTVRMSLRTTLIGLLVIVGMCAAMLYGISSYFGRDASMRDAEIAFQEKHKADGVAPSRQMESGVSFKPKREKTATAATDDTMDLESWYDGAGAGGADADIDSWYAAAGSNEGPADTTPIDNSYLINDTEPFTTTDAL